MDSDNSNYNKLAMLTNKFGAHVNFSGSSSEDARSFLADLEVHLESSKLKEKEKILVFKYALRGEASVWFKLHEDENLESLFEAFKERFFSDLDHLEAIKKITAANRSNYSSFVAMIDFMRVQAKTAGMDNEILVSFIIEALPDEWKSMLISMCGNRKKPCIDEIIEFCKVKLKMGEDRNECKAIEVRSLDQEPEVKLCECNKITYKKEIKKVVICYFCRKKGHVMRDCYALKNLRTKASDGVNVKMISRDDDEINRVDYSRATNFVHKCLNINSVCSSKLFLSVNGHRLKALIDSGCELNLLNNKVVFDRPKIESSIKLSTANGGSLGVVGKYKDLEVVIDGISYKADFIICNNLADACIIGSGFLAKNELKLCFKGKQVKIIYEEAVRNGMGLHRIDTGDAKPKAVAQYRLGAEKEHIINNQVKEWLNKGIVRKCKFSEWRSPVLVVPKPGVGLGFL